MKAWDIFSHSVRLVWRNRWDALRISGGLYAAYAVVQVVFLGSTDTSNGIDMTEVAPEDLGGVFFAAFLQSVVTLWIAVAWHRYVLLEEYPQGWLPSFRGGAILSYFWRSLGIALVIGFAVVVPVTILVSFAPILSVFAVFGAMFLAIVLGFRLAPALPAAATGEPFGFSDAWSATAGQTGTAIALAFIGLTAVFVAQLPVFAVTAISPGMGNIVFIVLNWFVTLVSASILTTLYGHYVQGRPID